MNYSVRTLKWYFVTQLMIVSSQEETEIWAMCFFAIITLAGDHHQSFFSLGLHFNYGLQLLHYSKFCVIPIENWNYLPLKFLFYGIGVQSHHQFWPKPGGQELQEVASYSSHLTSYERVVLERCSFNCMNHKNLAHGAESDATLPLLVLVLP